MKNILKLAIIYIIIFLIQTPYVNAQSEKKSVIYFYSSTCSSCQEIDSFVNDLATQHNLDIKKYNIADLGNKSRLNKYCEVYKVSEDDTGIVPAVFINNNFFIGENNIKKSLENEIVKNTNTETIEIYGENSNFENDTKRFSGLKIFSVFFTGLINGINPCAMSMLLFFISLLSVKKNFIIKAGSSFIIGKFITYFLLGTIFFNVLSRLNMGWIHNVIKIIILSIIIFFIILNIRDYFAVKHEQYGKIKLQLPVKLKKFNHNMIKKISKVESLNLIILISFILGVVISLGEFMCTGQIYLTTIITVLQTSAYFNLRAFVYLIIYNIAFVLPFFVVLLIIYRGKGIFEISDIITQKLSLIKILNTIIFLALGIYVILN